MLQTLPAGRTSLSSPGLLVDQLLLPVHTAQVQVNDVETVGGGLDDLPDWSFPRLRGAIALLSADLCLDRYIIGDSVDREFRDWRGSI